MTVTASSALMKRVWGWSGVQPCVKHISGDKSRSICWSVYMLIELLAHLSCAKWRSFIIFERASMLPLFAFAMVKERIR